jgi:uncharacterized protein YggT (Ycf19 family)
MNLVNWILNLAGLFLWIDWRTASAANRPQPVISLASALRETGKRRSRGWNSLGGVAALLALRPFFYYTIGSAVEWTPVMDLLAISLPFRSDQLDRMFAYSTVSFAVTLGFYYGCLLFVAAVRTAKPETEVMRRFTRAQLGWLMLAPRPLKLALPFLAVAAGWFLLVPILVFLEIMPSLPPSQILWQQAGTLAASALLAWRWFLVALFLLYALNTYVYLGTHPAWEYLAEICGALLRPLWFLRIGKLDFAPFAAIALLLGLTEVLVRPFVIEWFGRTVA